MLRFNSDYKKADKQKNMEFSLHFFLMVELIAAGYGFITMGPVKIFNNNAIKWFFIIWIVSLFAASWLIMILKEVTFAICYFLHRVLQLYVLISVYLVTKEVVISLYLIEFFLFEMAWILNGLSYQNMYKDFCMCKDCKHNRCKEFNDTKTIENARGSSFPTYELQMDAKEIIRRPVH
ncbi:hypothetical protein CAEBREN_21088 [Caenorhabditis brenneri]|uniref:Uncharacterized protein n=1 Tax=Caenorhabditis brenneri TaxID=135651 RepID=G0NUB3_CAEBE|nr:hypothetical protein CAEBREN_21088 [Caenorhabditis brenneri]